MGYPTRKDLDDVKRKVQYELEEGAKKLDKRADELKEQADEYTKLIQNKPKIDRIHMGITAFNTIVILFFLVQIIGALL